MEGAASASGEGGRWWGARRQNAVRYGLHVVAVEHEDLGLGKLACRRSHHQWRRPVPFPRLDVSHPLLVGLVVEAEGHLKLRLRVLEHGLVVVA